MSLYNKAKFHEFFNSPNNKILLRKLKKFASTNVDDLDSVLNTMKLTKNNIKTVHKTLSDNNPKNIINIPKKFIKLFSSKCFDNFETEYKGTLSTSSNMIQNNKLHTAPTKTSMFSAYFNCRNDNKFKRVVVLENNYDMTLLHFSSDDYSGRVYYRYMFTQLLLGDDYDQLEVIQNHSKYTGFYRDGTIGQEIIYYFLEIYNYDRFNFFKEYITRDYVETKKHGSAVHGKEIGPPTSDKLNEMLSSKLWRNEYPAFDAVIYIDHNWEGNTDFAGVEIVVFISEIYLEILESIYINDGTNFTPNKSDVNTVLDPNDIVVDIDKLEQYINNRYVTPDNIIMVGGNPYKQKYIKYKGKYMALRKLGM